MGPERSSGETAGPKAAGASDAANAVRGLWWALAGAALTALFMVPWKAAATYGGQSEIVLVMLTTAALVNTLASVVPARLGGRLLPLTRTMGLLAAAMALLTLLGNLASAAAISRIDGPLLSLLQRAEVVVVALGAWFALGERVEGRFFLGTAVAGVGLWVITGSDLGGGGTHALGVLYGLASAVAFGGMNVLVRRHARAIHPTTVNALRLWFAVLLWFALERRVPDVAAMHPRMLLFAALSALCGPVSARLSIMYALRHVEARMVALVLLTTPVLTLLSTWLLLGQWPAERSLWGGLLMLTGIAIPVFARAMAGRRAARALA